MLNKGIISHENRKTEQCVNIFHFPIHLALQLPFVHLLNALHVCEPSRSLLILSSLHNLSGS